MIKKIAIGMIGGQLLGVILIFLLVIMLIGGGVITEDAEGVEEPGINLTVGFPYVKGMPVTLTQGYWTTLEEARQWWGNEQPPYSSGMHRAVDYSAGSGTEVISILSGTVVYAGYTGGYGNNVIIESKIDEETYYVLYGHFSTITATQNSVIPKGSTIGLEGNTGLSTGSHVHIEIAKEFSSGSLAGDERIDYQKLSREEA